MFFLKTQRKLVMIAAVLASCGHKLPSQLDDLPGSLSRTGVKTSGFFQDAWVADRASVTLQQPAGQQMLSVRGLVPRIADSNFHSGLELRVDGKAVAHWTLGLGDFVLSAPVAPGVGEKRVTLVFGNSQELPN